MASKMSAAQIKTLGTLIARGGEMNSYAGQKGFYTNSVAVLHRLGYVTKPYSCGGTHGDTSSWSIAGGTVTTPGLPCTVEHTELVGQGGGKDAYGRITITDAGRAAYAAATAGDASVVAPVKRVKKVAAPAPVEIPAQGARVLRDGIRGQVLEVGMRAGIAVAAVAFGAVMMWVKVAELLAA